MLLLENLLSIIFSYFWSIDDRNVGDFVTVPFVAETLLIFIPTLFSPQTIIRLDNFHYLTVKFTDNLIVTINFILLCLHLMSTFAAIYIGMLNFLLVEVYIIFHPFTFNLFMYLNLFLMNSIYSFVFNSVKLFRKQLKV